MSSKPAPKHQNQIFHDPSGKRWKFTKITLLCAVVLIASFLSIYLPKMLAPSQLTPYPSSKSTAVSAPTMPTLSPEELADKLSTTNLPVIGEGPLVRIVRIHAYGEELFANDVYANTVTKTLNTVEKLAVGTHEYALERHGQANNKKIALTFDDGPDQTYTHQILDILSEQNMPSSFFLVGENIVRYPELAARLTREGHTAANHTFTHIDFDLVSKFKSEQEIIQTGRVITATTHHSTSFFRPPYGGNNDQGMRDTLRGLLYAQKLGYINASYTFDTNDWQKSQQGLPPLPTFDGSNIVMLLHDGGGDRSKTIAYLKELGPAARANGYSFTNLDDLYSQGDSLAAATIPSTADTMALTMFTAVLVWPQSIIGVLFFVSAFSIVLSMCINVILALIQMKRTKYGRRPKGYNPLVSVLVPAYNEDVVLINTVRSLLKSKYRNVEIIIIDDGSKDDTYKIAKEIARKYKRVRSFTQPNGGKSAALNNGIEKAKGEILICIDADTLFPPDVLNKMVRHFADPKVGAVAGSVKIGNLTTMITRWQALEYTIGIHLERTAQALLGAIIVVPGACGAWRKEAVVKAGGFSTSTLAEDCDLTLAIHKDGYTVIQDNSAIGYTEAPQTYRALAKQRFRWIFGNLQSFWKHRDLMFRRQYGWLGMFVLPYALFNILLPFIFIPVLFTLLIENLATGQYATIILFAGITLVIQYILAIIAITMAKERYNLLVAVPLTRLMYSPLKTYLLFGTALTALKGAQVGWNKLQRTGNVHYPKVQLLKLKSTTRDS